MWLSINISILPQNAPRKLSHVNEMFSRVTADFHIPGMPLMIAWKHWCCGDPFGQTNPYIFLQWWDLPSSKKQKTLSHYRCMMMEIQTKIPHRSWISAPTIQQARKKLQSVLPKLPVRDVTPQNVKDARISSNVYCSQRYSRKPPCISPKWIA
ncbi:hypothetical protein PHMEG_00014443 [Phytophthora megakarya]|uniref:Uncharacterized protein n=1 Tax=Phytophthora megakarya TaxID=4795 RepID=A0A225W5V7_9STRA|nr:hypothetical protein PHMEG_00014443 [Phytophthora megakarya]